MKILRQIATSPLFYAYWAVLAGGAIAHHFNSGASGHWSLGLAHLSSLLISFLIYYWHLSLIRRHFGLAHASAIKLIFSTLLLRARAFLFFVPAFAFFGLRGDLERFSSEFVNIVMVPPQEQFAFLIGHLNHFKPILFLLMIMLFTDWTVRAVVAANGSSKHGLKQLWPALKNHSVAIMAFTIADLAFIFLGFYISYNYQTQTFARTITPALVIDCLLDGAGYLLQLGGVIFLTLRFRARAQ